MVHKKVVKALTKKYNKDPRVINVITRHQFKFLHDVINNPIDDRPVRYMYLGIFSQKNTRNKLTYIQADPVKQSKVILGNIGL